MNEKVNKPDPMKMDVSEYVDTRWEMMKNTVSMDMAEVLNLNDPDTQMFMRREFMIRYLKDRMEGLERLAGVLKRCVEHAIPDEKERESLINAISRDWR